MIYFDCGIIMIERSEPAGNVQSLFLMLSKIKPGGGSELIVKQPGEGHQQTCALQLIGLKSEMITVPLLTVTYTLRYALHIFKSFCKEIFFKI